MRLDLFCKLLLFYTRRVASFCHVRSGSKNHPVDFRQSFKWRVPGFSRRDLALLSDAALWTLPSYLNRNLQNQPLEIPHISFTEPGDTMSVPTKAYNRKGMPFRRLGPSGLRVPLFSLGGCTSCFFRRA